MEGIQEFIIEQIKRLEHSYSNSNLKIHIKYSYDKITNFHIIEVSPEKVRRKDKIYIDWEYNLLKEFNNKFPSEDILVSEPDKCNDMSNLIYEYETNNIYNIKLLLFFSFVYFIDKWRDFLNILNKRIYFN